MRGHIRKRGSRWAVVVEIDKHPKTGRRRQRWISVRTRREAERKLAEVVREIDAGEYSEPVKITVAGYLRRWLVEYAETAVRPNTFQGYRSIVEGHLIPALGGLQLSNLRPANIRAYYSSKLKDGRLDGRSGGLSAKTVVQHHRVLNEALSHAVRWEIVSRNVAQAVDPPRASRVEMTALDEHEVNRLLEIAEGSEHYDALYCATHTGLGRSELLGLRWKNVDLEFATVSIVQGLHRRRSGGGFLFEEPKRPSRRRTVALTPGTAVLLRDRRKRQQSDAATIWTDDWLVFGRPDGSPPKPDALSRAVPALCRQAGTKVVRLHDLRHTHATVLLKQGVPSKVVAERLGHSTVSTTLDIYSHVTPGMQREAAMTFERALARAPGVEQD